MQQILAIPVAWRLFAIFAAGTAVGCVVNLAICRWSWIAGKWSPWTAGSGAALIDRLPVFGWLTWRRRAGEPGFAAGFWLRPLLVELLTGASFAALYWWEVVRQGLLPAGNFGVQALPPGIWPAPGGLAASLFMTCQSHWILVALMIAASFIDIDDKIIPDQITIPGTLAGLILAAAAPWSLLPCRCIVAGGGTQVVVEFLTLVSPNPWPPKLAGQNETWSLMIGLACYWGWCFALLPRHWRPRHGFPRACRIFWARMARERLSLLVLGLAIFGGAGVAYVWSQGGVRWAGLLTALAGLAASGGLIWTVRIIGTAVLNKEAMGFGDVTLMAMIGTFLGWQACLIVFFVAPFFALIIGAGYLILHRQPEIPYGPFLCLGAATVVVKWGAIWNWGQPLFELGWLVPSVILACMALMALLLGAMRFVGSLFAKRA